MSALPNNLVELHPVHTLAARDISKAVQSEIPTRHEALYLVNSYYQMQEYRIAQALRSAKLAEIGDPNSVITYFGGQFGSLEKQLQTALGAFAKSTATGKWALDTMGIGPVLSAGLLAHIDVARAPTVGHVWSFAGLNPGAEWNKGEKRPWNADLKTLCWKIGESFVKVSGNEKSLYGRLYAERKRFEIERNEAGAYKEQAAAVLARKKIGKDTDAYKAYSVGKLPPAHLHARAKRYTVKLFLSHWHDMRTREVLERPAPPPYILAHSEGAHVHYVEPEVPFDKYLN